LDETGNTHRAESSGDDTIIIHINYTGIIHNFVTRTALQYQYITWTL